MIIYNSLDNKSFFDSVCRRYYVRGAAKCRSEILLQLTTPGYHLIGLINGNDASGKQIQQLIDDVVIDFHLVVTEGNTNDH